MKPTIRATTKDNSRRRYPGIGGRYHNPVGIVVRRETSLARQKAWAALSPREQLASLDRRLGESKGAGKQRARLMASLKNATGRPDGREVVASIVSAEGIKTSKLKAKDRRENERAQARQGK